MPKENSKKSIQNTRFEKRSQSVEEKSGKKKTAGTGFEIRKRQKNDSALKLIFYSQNGNI